MSKGKSKKEILDLYNSVLKKEFSKLKKTQAPSDSDDASIESVEMIDLIDKKSDATALSKIKVSKKKEKWCDQTKEEKAFLAQIQGIEEEESTKEKKNKQANKSTNK